MRSTYGCSLTARQRRSRYTPPDASSTSCTLPSYLPWPPSPPHLGDTWQVPPAALGAAARDPAAVHAGHDRHVLDVLQVDWPFPGHLTRRAPPIANPRPPRARPDAPLGTRPPLPTSLGTPSPSYLPWHALPFLPPLARPPHLTALGATWQVRALLASNVNAKRFISDGGLQVLLSLLTTVHMEVERSAHSQVLQTNLLTSSADKVCDLTTSHHISPYLTISHHISPYLTTSSFHGLR